MRWLLINTDYPAFLDWHYQQHPGLEQRSYDEQLQARNGSLFGVADFYSVNLKKLGHEAWDIHANNESQQLAWAREHGITINSPQPSVRSALQSARKTIARTPLRRLKPVLRPLLRRLKPDDRRFHDVLTAQIEHYKPDVILNHDPGAFGSAYLKQFKTPARAIVCQIASPLPPGENFSVYDLVLSSLPNLVEHFRARGIAAEPLRFAFEPRILSTVKPGPRTIPVSFVGSLSWNHKSRVQLLEHLCRTIDLQIWGQGVEGLPADSAIRRAHQGPAWGISMYQIIGASRITLNHHIGVAENYANNMRLFEATGLQTLLVTDFKQNLDELFKSGKELVAYRNPEECAEFIQHYLAHDDERSEIATTGQQRTLREHNYQTRMRELVQIVERCL